MSQTAPMSTNSPMVRFDKVTKSYGAFVVLDQLDLEIAAGEKVAIIGPSGSGKTTILRILMTLERIDGGHITVKAARSELRKSRCSTSGSPAA